MHKVITQLSEVKLIGITARTSNAAEMNADTAKIGITMQRFFADKLQDKILNRKTPKKVFSEFFCTFLEKKLLFQYKFM
ncbi:hypothetical protein [Rickettsia montanensis]|uniref:hypothetical protein n=1 Tax=Rickettsia montanensis TaxID=33991 RepID=UPI0002DD9C65|nr:hypothetical protein [Rickettsia montanensis]